MQNQKSALGLDGNITALIGYPIGIIALVLIFIEKDNKFVRFHALQSVLWSVALTILITVFAVIGGILLTVISMASPSLGGILWLLFGLLFFGIGLAWFGGLVFGAIKAYGSQMTKLPIVGGFAEKWT